MAKKKDPKKKPSDYPILRVRIQTEEDLTSIKDEVEVVRSHLNKFRGKDEKVWMGNHVIVEAIKIGLKELRSRKR